MFVKIDENGKVLEVNSEKLNGFLDKQFDIDLDKFMFATVVKGEIIYDEEKYKKHSENHTILVNTYKEIGEIESWLETYDRVCHEHLRCERLGIECHHNIAEWDSLAVSKINKLNELRQVVQ